MKKLLYTLFAVSIIFSACEEEDSALANTNNNNSSLAIGDMYQGGIIFYLDENGGGLIAARSDQGQAEWGCYEAEFSGANGTEIGTGNQNTIDIINANCSPYSGGNSIAANICANLTLEGYSDWFLPSKDGLTEMYLNKDLIGGFADRFYWSSSRSGNYAFGRGFDGSYDWEINYQLYYVRAIRSF